MIIEIQDRERVTVHADVADTVDSMLRGDPVAPELRWRDEEGVHRSQARPRPSPREQIGAERFAGLVGSRPAVADGAGLARRGRVSAAATATPSGAARSAPATGPGPAAAGARPAAARPAKAAPRGSLGPAGDASGGGPALHFAVPPLSDRLPGARVEDAPFVAGEIADRGPLERGAAPAATRRCPRARASWSARRRGATRRPGRSTALKADEGTGPVNADDLEDDDDDDLATAPLGIEEGESGEAVLTPGGAPLPTLRILPQGISRKRLEQAIRELQLPVVIARDVDEADVVMTLRNEYKQKTPMLREAEERALPIYVLKSNTMPQMQSSLTSIFSLEIDPREAAMRETEEAIGIVLNRSEPVELSPQNAYIRRLQHQMAERANLVSRSRGREPYRRVRLYPDAARSSWR